jgi:hypothetical protein
MTKNISRKFAAMSEEKRRKRAVTEWTSRRKRVEERE